jgi:prepilin signal peptidase PulO-like enzyme (type II secretory pathway)
MPTVLLFLLGLCLGSFISALSYRYPRSIPFVKGRSFCPKCKEQIAWYDNIPLLSFLLLRGKCRHCKKKISIRYPITELATGIGFVQIGLNPYWLIIFSLLLLIFIVDMEHQIIPDDFVFIGVTFVLFFSLVTNHQSLFPGLFAGFLAASLLMFLHLFTRGRGMGLGDVKFAVLGGLIVGIKLTYVWLFLSFLTGGLVGIILIIARRAGLKDKIAFGPFLIVGIVLAVLFGDKVLKIVGF